MTKALKSSGIVIAALLMLCAATARGAHAQSFSGTTLTVTVSSDDVSGLPSDVQLQLIGTWTIAFADNGGYAVGKDNTVTAAGLWTLAGNELTLTDTEGPFSCSGPGTYAISTDGSTYAFTAINDDCAGREFLLTAHRFSAQ